MGMHKSSVCPFKFILPFCYYFSVMEFTSRRRRVGMKARQGTWGNEYMCVFVGFPLGPQSCKTCLLSSGGGEK